MFEEIVKRGTLMTVFLLIICVLGIAAALRIPVQMIPDLEIRTITVETAWPGATPQDVEREITIEQEEYLGSVPGLERMVATVSSGQSMVELEFPYDIDITETLIRVNNALSQVPGYPVNVDEPRVLATAASNEAFMYFRMAPLPGNPRGINMNMMGDFIDDTVRRRLERVPGVSQVALGAPERQLQILIDSDRLASRGLTLIDVRDAITSRNRDVSGGDLESGKRSYLLRTVGRFEDISEMENTILARRDDSIVRLLDVADVRLGHFEPTETLLNEGQPALLLSLRREAGTNVIEISDAVQNLIADLNESFLEPAGMQLTLIGDDSGYVEDSLQNVWVNLGLGAVLSTIVMFAFLRSIPMTFIGVIGIPVCTIAAFLGLLLAGRTINVISLAGVAFAIGMTLDNSIVVLESIDMARRRGLGRFRAAVEGVQEVWPAVMASTLTTVLVFVPITFIQEEAGQLYSDVAIAIAASILASMFVSVTIVPTFGARLMKDGSAYSASGSNGGQDNGHWAVASSILAIVAWIVKRPLNRLVCIVVTLGLGIGILVALTPAAEYLPEGEEAKIFAFMTAPPGYNLSTMREIAEQIEVHLYPHLQDSPDEYAEGRSSVPALGVLAVNAQPQSIMVMATTKAPGQIDDLADTVSRIFESYPGMRSFVSRGSIITSNDGGTRSVNLDVSGPDLESIYRVVSSAYERAERVFDNPSIQTTPATLSLSQPLILVQPDWERAAEMGLTAEGLGFSVAALTDGAYIDDFSLNDDQIDIYLYSAGGQEVRPDGLGDIAFYTPQGTTVPLSSVAHIEEVVDTNSIRRVDSNRTVTLSIIPPRDVALETAVGEVNEKIVRYLRERGEIPLNVDIDISGAADQLEATQESITANYSYAIVIIYLLLVAILRHWGYPVLIMTTIPLGFAGGIAGLFLLNLVGGTLPVFGLPQISQPFDMISMLGFLILMGTVVNNPILLVHRALETAREGRFSPKEAVCEAVSSRLRPIFMSSITTVFGLLPLVVIPGAGSELYRGVGVIVLFGILGTVLATLTFLPALMVFVLEFDLKRKRQVTQTA